MAPLRECGGKCNKPDCRTGEATKCQGTSTLEGGGVKTAVRLSEDRA
jgi:hypothetical protein